MEPKPTIIQLSESPSSTGDWGRPKHSRDLYDRSCRPVGYGIGLDPWSPPRVHRSWPVLTPLQVRLDAGERVEVDVEDWQVVAVGSRTAGGAGARGNGGAGRVAAARLILVRV